jgi:beta-lactamase class A
MKFVVSVAIASFFFVSGCGGAARPPASVAAPASARVAPPAVVPPLGPTAEETVEWALATLAAGGQLSAAEIEARFAPSFLAEFPPDQVAATFAALASQLGPVKVLEKKSTPPREAEALLETAQGALQIAVGMTAGTPRKIEAFVFRPAAPVPRTQAEVAAQIASAGAKSEFFVGELEQGRCIPRVGAPSSERLAIGSAFKLWVLLALDEKLRHKGGATWDTPLAIRDEAKSLPSGGMRDLRAGTERPLREYAKRMIAMSDNTATDHLIEYVGRGRVEAALALTKHGAPALDTPFLRTRELFALKLLASPEEVAAYERASVAGKRKLLDGLRARPLPESTEWWKAPRPLDLEWFADGLDLCNAMNELATRAKQDPKSELLAILGANPGVPVDRKLWDYVGFKGGSEPGVLNLTWLGRRSDGKWFVVAITVNDRAKPLPEGAVVQAATSALRILGVEANSK